MTTTEQLSHQQKTEQHSIVGEQEQHQQSGARTSSPRTIVENPDVRLSLPADGSVKVQMGNQVVVPLTITPIADEMTAEVNKIAGFEFEVRFKADQLTILRRSNRLYYQVLG